MRKKKNYTHYCAEPWQRTQLRTHCVLLSSLHLWKYASRSAPFQLNVSTKKKESKVSDSHEEKALDFIEYLERADNVVPESIDTSQINLG